MHDTVFVTGGAGFIGPHVVRRLLQGGSRVVSFDNYMTGSAQALSGEGEGLEIVKGDVRDLAQVTDALVRARPNAILHLAAIHYIPYCNAHPAEAMDVNVTGTFNLLQAAKDVGVTKVVMASSAAVYPIQDEACREDAPTGPTDIYGATKVALEALGQSFAAETGIPVTSARFFNVYGPGETNPHVIPDILAQLGGDGPVKLGNMTPKRDYVHVSDIADGLVALLGSDHAEHRAYNIGTGSEHSVSELIEVLSGAVGRDIEVVSEPGRKRRLDRQHLLSDISRMREEIGWEPRYTLQDGLRELVLETVGGAS
ncbi:MAG: SDR family NAD(P)-dependent oxidoreductase [Thermoleophilia bacterium]|nr:SDR family NAD(P)-dependent oxidoreductase [Thermoleophilia bacterium]